jgi:hypothetical protein
LDVDKFCPKLDRTLAFTLNNALNNLEESLSLSPSNQCKLSIVLKNYQYVTHQCNTMIFFLYVAFKESPINPRI